MCVSAAGYGGAGKSDVLGSVLFAQWVANKKHPACAQAQIGYDEYRDVLKSGWLTFNTLHYATFQEKVLAAVIAETTRNIHG